MAILLIFGRNFFSKSIFRQVAPNQPPTFFAVFSSFLALVCAHKISTPVDLGQHAQNQRFQKYEENFEIIVEITQNC